MPLKSCLDNAIETVVLLINASPPNDSVHSIQFIIKSTVNIALVLKSNCIKHIHMHVHIHIVHMYVYMKYAL